MLKGASSGVRARHLLAQGGEPGASATCKSSIALLETCLCVTGRGVPSQAHAPLASEPVYTVPGTGTTNRSGTRSGLVPR